MYYSSLYGFSQQYFPDITFIRQNIVIFVPFICVFGLLFTRSFLLLHFYTPKIDRIIKGFIYLMCIMTPFVFYESVFAVNLAQIMGFFFLIFALCSGIISLIYKNRTAKYFLIAWIFFILGGILKVIMFSGGIQNNFITEYGFQIGSVLEAILLSFALADRINILKAEAETANISLMSKITEHREMESKYRGLIRDAGDAIVLAGEDGLIREINKSTERLLRCSINDLADIHFDEIIKGDKRSDRRLYFEEFWNRKAGSLHNGRLITVDGKEITIDATCTVLEIESTKVLQCIIRDITARKIAEEEMARYREYGFSDALSKPFTIEELSRVVHKVISNQV